MVTLLQMSGTWAYEEATSGFVPWEAALGSQPPSGAPGGRLWPDVGAAQQSGLGTSGDNRITGDRRGRAACTATRFEGGVVILPAAAISG